MEALLGATMLGIYVACILGCQAIARRRGASTSYWGLMGAFLGPLALIGAMFIPREDQSLS